MRITEAGPFQAALDQPLSGVDGHTVLLDLHGGLQPRGGPIDPTMLAWVEEFPDVDAVQDFAEALIDVGWARYLDSRTSLGTAFVRPQ
jgi:hypothetical protein